MSLLLQKSIKKHDYFFYLKCRYRYLTVCHYLKMLKITTVANSVLFPISKLSARSRNIGPLIRYRVNKQVGFKTDRLYVCRDSLDKKQVVYISPFSRFLLVNFLCSGLCSFHYLPVTFSGPTIYSALMRRCLVSFRIKPTPFKK